ncbi:hypothetical protein [Variovorax sp. RCC_210]|uniref:hypothetical protein n=1 Tax=Variovorax sp. RCC_210 TaxID=3239217 RepID=UPI000D5FDF5D
MDIQLLMRLDRMTPPRVLTSRADLAAAEELLNKGLIEASHQTRFTKSGAAKQAILVKVITEKGRLAVAQEKTRPHGNSGI